MNLKELSRSVVRESKFEYSLSKKDIEKLITEKMSENFMIKEDSEISFNWDAFNNDVNDIHSFEEVCISTCKKENLIEKQNDNRN